MYVRRDFIFTTLNPNIFIEIAIIPATSHTFDSR